MNKEQVITNYARYELDQIKRELADNGKHLIRTATLKDRILSHVDVPVGDENIDYLISLGVQQAAQSVLWADGWRSVVDGFFANLSENKNLLRFKLMDRNAYTRKERSEAAYEMVHQTVMSFAGADFIGLVEEPSTEEIIADLEADAI